MRFPIKGQTQNKLDVGVSGFGSLPEVRTNSLNNLFVSYFQRLKFIEGCFIF